MRVAEEKPQCEEGQIRESFKNARAELLLDWLSEALCLDCERAVAVLAIFQNEFEARCRSLKEKGA